MSGAGAQQPLVLHRRLAHRAPHAATGDGTRTTRLTRDEHGRVLAADTDGRRRLFDYDAAGQLDRRRAAGGERATRYDAAGRLTGGRVGTDLHATTPPASCGPAPARTASAASTTTPPAAASPRAARAATAATAWDPLGRLTGIAPRPRGPAPARTGLRVDALGELADVDGTAARLGQHRPAAPLAALGDQPDHRRRRTRGRTHRAARCTRTGSTRSAAAPTRGVRPPGRARRSATAASSPSTA